MAYTKNLAVSSGNRVILSGSNIQVTGSLFTTQISGTTSEFTVVTGSTLRTRGIGVGADYQTNGANIAAFSAEDPNITINMGASSTVVGTIKWYMNSTHYMTLGYQGSATEGVGLGIPRSKTNQELSLYSANSVQLTNGYDPAQSNMAGMVLNFSGGNYFTWRGASGTDALRTDQNKMVYIGNFKLGSTTTDAANAKLDVNGSTIVSGNLTVTGSISELSTRKIKTNIESITNQLYTVNQLNPVSYVRLDDNRKEYGFISEEVKEIYPEFVVGEGINYPKMVSVLVSSIKELTQKIENQQKEINILKNRDNK